MSIIEAFLLGILQGLTEFLPISSSGHLVLGEHVLGIQLDPQSLKAFDVILHAGTLVALLVYFWKDWMEMLFEGIVKDLKESLLLKIIIATIPAVIVGLWFGDAIDEYFRSPMMVGRMMMAVALVLALCERFPWKKSKEIPSLMQGILIGCFQAIALIPGVSRSGMTMAGGMFQGMKRHSAAKFSFLLGTPAIAGAALLIGLKVWSGEYTLPPFGTVIIGFFASAVSSFVCMHFLLQFVKRHGLWVFSIYLFFVSCLIFFLG